jgi:hypothetical protein
LQRGRIDTLLLDDLAQRLSAGLGCFQLVGRHPQRCRQDGLPVEIALQGAGGQNADVPVLKTDARDCS